MLSMKETVVLEGKSGAGKSTAVVALVEWLKQNLGGSVETQQPQKPKDQHPAYQGLFGKAFAVPRIMAGYIYDCTMWLLSKLGFSTKILPVLDVSRTTTTAQHTPEAQPNSVTSLVLAHVYFRLEDMKDQTVEMTLGSLLVQFVEQLPDAISPVQELYRQHNGSTFSAETSPSAEDFRKTILLVLGDHRACVFLDGLDECGKAFLRELLPHIHYLQKQSGMGLVLTDRINQSKQTWFKFFPSATRIPLHADDGDVRAYVNMRLHTFAEQTTRSDHWICNETLRKAVTDTVAKASGGMYASLRLNNIRTDTLLGFSWYDCMSNMYSGQGENPVLTGIYKRYVERSSIKRRVKINTSKKF
jgi:energy-coupling factor transporter ATP-binding protein EcfA2